MNITCDTLLLSDFITCYVDGDYACLGENGEAVWQEVYNEFIDRSGGQKENEKYQLNLEVNSLNFRMMAIEATVDLLRVYYIPDAVDFLRSQGYKVDYDPEDMDAYHASLDRVLSKAQTLTVDIEDRIARLKKLIEADGTNETSITRQYFNDVLTGLAKYHGYHIDEHSITVSRYISLLKLYSEHAKQLESLAKR